ncbi:MAG: hypothetical protein ACD_79C00517G0001 [uncultured bacterium]|nr:MAG: hypothetical protein ACD_79C00517G0001 [uncultured bacterium]
MHHKDKILSDIFKTGKKTLSFEVFPPKTAQGMENLIFHLKQLEKYSADYISVTYGAGGSSQDKSLELLDAVHKNFERTVVAHFTCVGLDLNKIESFINRLSAMNIRNILALRGDPPKDSTNFDFNKNVFKYASDLVKFIKNKTNMCIGVAGYPEGHVQAPSKEADWDNLKFKIEQGANFVITQLFFDNSFYFRFKEGMLKRNIKVPLIPGILPVASIETLNKAVNLSGATITAKFKEIINKHTQPDDFKKASYEYVINQIRELQKDNVPGIHYYILNRSEVISEILENL